MLALPALLAEPLLRPRARVFAFAQAQHASVVENALQAVKDCETPSRPYRARSVTSAAKTSSSVTAATSMARSGPQCFVSEPRHCVSLLLPRQVGETVRTRSSSTAATVVALIASVAIFKRIDSASHQPPRCLGLFPSGE